jgi:glutamine cyclotransferase
MQEVYKSSRHISLSSFFILFLFATIGCNESKKTKPEDISIGTEKKMNIAYTITAAYPHDTTSFTEGLLMHNNKLYESTGAPEEMPQTSSLFGEVDLRTGKINVKASIDKKIYFGEGIVFLNNKIYQLTYINKIGFIYDAATFKQTGQFNIPSPQGWGFTTDSTYLIMSDGSDTLTYLDPEHLNTVKVLKITDENGPVKRLNELEFVKGSIYANVFGTDLIVKIDPATAKVIGRIDAADIARQQREKYEGALEMNGIAYDPVKDRLYITGKMWTEIYELQVK